MRRSVFLLFPIKFDITVAPGQTYSDTITVINPNNFPIGVQPEVENLAGGNQGSIDLVETNIPHGLSAWITINKSELASRHNSSYKCRSPSPCPPTVSRAVIMARFSSAVFPRPRRAPALAFPAGSVRSFF